MELHGEKTKAVSFSTVLLSNKNGNVSGTLKSDHILLPDRYYINVSFNRPAVSSGKLLIKVKSSNAKIENSEYRTINDNDTLNGAKTINIHKHQYHQFLLSGFREQHNYADYYQIYNDRKGYFSFRINTIKNPAGVPYHVDLKRVSDGNVICSFKNPKGKHTGKLIKAEPGYYYIQVIVDDTVKCANQQIVYQLYLTRTKKPKSISLNKQIIGLYTISGCNTTTLTTKLNRKKASITDIAFKTNRPSVASISKIGKLTAKKPGKATITCYAIDKPSVKATCVVTVKNPRLTLKERAKGLYVGDRTRLSVKKVPHTLSVTWKSSNPKVASISSDGTVHGKTAGSAKIYAVSKHGIKSKSCVITVRKKPQPKPKPTPDPKKDPTNQDNHNDTIAPALSLSSAHLSPRGTMLVTANVVGGRFSVSGGISIQSKSGKSCVIKAITSRGTGTIAYTVNGKTASKHIVIY